MQFIVSGQRIAVENFVTGKLYTILWKNDTQVTLTCISIGADCVVFQGEAPLNLFTLTMQNADTIDTIEPTQLGTTNYNNLINKPSINGVDLIGNKTSAALGIRDVPAIIESDDGKILTASSDGTYTWQPAPSSGTMDYTQLNNKPQINSVTLTGNVSLADLGAAAAADIPTTPADIGAEPAITSENMLDADLVDDTSSTHKFATAAQLAQITTNQNNISNQQNTIADGGNGYAIINGKRLYMTDTTPTDGRQGDIWIDDNTVKTYGRTAQLYDYLTMSEGVEDAYLAEDGSVVSANVWCISDYIPCDGTSFTINPVGGNATSICLYDENKTYITGKAYMTGGAHLKAAVSITSSTTAKYIRFTYSNSTSPNPDDLSAIMLNSGSTALPYIGYYDWT